MFEITQDCRIDWKNFKKWDIVSEKDTGWYFTSCMKPLNSEQPTAEPEKVVEAPAENVDEETAEKENADEVVENADEVEEKPTKTAKKRK